MKCPRLWSVFLMKSIEWGKRELGIPEKEPFERMNFIR